MRESQKDKYEEIWMLTVEASIYVTPLQPHPGTLSQWL